MAQIILLVAFLLKSLHVQRREIKIAISGRTRQRGGGRVGRQGLRRKDGRKSRAGGRRSKKKAAAGGRRSGRRFGRQQGVNQLYGAPSDPLVDQYGAPGNQVDINPSCCAHV